MNTHRRWASVLVASLGLGLGVGLAPAEAVSPAAAAAGAEVSFGPRGSTDPRVAKLAQGRRPRPGVAPTGTVMPKPPVQLPAALDRRAGYAAQNTCDPTDKPGSVAYGQLLKSIWPKGVVGISRSCTESGTSEHKDGRAVDFMINAAVPEQKKIADDIVAWITADNGAIARRLGVMYLIWNRKIWGIYNAEAGWQPYSGVSPHTDHIHTSLTWDGAFKRTSWWTGVALTTWDEGPCRVYAGELAPIYTARNIDDCAPLKSAPKTTHASAVLGTSSADVTAAQRLLGAPVTGKFDYATWQVVRAWQALKTIPVTGVLDQVTWSILDPASKR